MKPTLPLAFRTLTLAPIMAASLCSASFAHTPLCACYGNGDGTVLCEGGFSDGASAAGIAMKVVDGTGNAIVDGKMDSNSEFEFTAPEGPYSVVFEGGEGHQIVIPSTDIAQ
ncbi:hypothetical protein [Phaeovulum veldkampii]|nr:hypothetical protein [Phaeovulum veldkampii]TDQ63337.1 hypothetical protein EV658_10211 [Phaeovulum veldkampii DSM 11550]